MDQAILAARALGKAIQADERFTRFAEAQRLNEADTKLQELINEFHGTRAELDREISKEDKDQTTIKDLDAKLKDMYKEIFSNQNMVDFTKARGELETLMSFINQIITGSTNGTDPDTIEYTESCGGSCSSCSGCH